MISFDWLWSLPSEFGASSTDKAHCPKRQSICELEGDAFVDGLSSFMAILTHKYK
jgi:DNA polymerase zeta